MLPIFSVPYLAILATFLSTLPLLIRADQKLDGMRLGNWLSDIPIYRSGQGMNIVTAQVGTNRVDVNLTISEYSNPAERAFQVLGASNHRTIGPSEV